MNKSEVFALLGITKAALLLYPLADIKQDAWLYMCMHGILQVYVKIGTKLSKAKLANPDVLIGFSLTEVEALALYNLADIEGFNLGSNTYEGNVYGQLHNLIRQQLMI